MNKEFMRGYYRNTYQHPVDEAVKESREYEKTKNSRYDLEDKFTEMLGGHGTALHRAFNEYNAALAAEHNVIEEELYLMGAADREKMIA